MLHVCAHCTTRYAPDLVRCPNCQSTDWRSSTDVDAEQEAAAAVQEPVPGAESDPEGGAPSAGISSTRFSSTASRSSSGGPASPLFPAPGVVSPSSTPPQPTPDPKPSSSAGTTAGSTPATTSDPNASED